ncbi:MAG TPA: hypothetical protein VF043_01650 [Ktedonobacteraceae bacterium]
MKQQKDRSNEDDAVLVGWILAGERDAFFIWPVSGIRKRCGRRVK